MTEQKPSRVRINLTGKRTVPKPKPQAGNEPRESRVRINPSSK